MLKQWSPNVKLTLVANPDYWGSKPAITTVIYKPDPGQHRPSPGTADR